MRNVPLSQRRGELEAMRRDIKAFIVACTVRHLNQHYDQVSSAPPSHPTCVLSVDFLDVSPKDRAALACSAMAKLAGTPYLYSNAFQYYRM